MKFKDIQESLEQIARSAKSAKDAAELGKAIAAARDLLKSSNGTAPLQALDSELSVWQTKLPVIFKEPIGRQGMAKHALHWIEELKRVG